MRCSRGGRGTRTGVREFLHRGGFGGLKIRVHNLVSFWTFHS